MSPYVIPGIRRADLDFASIMKTVAQYFNLQETALVKKNRKKELVFARQLICYFARKYTHTTLKKIAKNFGFDHTSVIHSINSIQDYLSVVDEATLAAVAAIEKELSQEFKLIENKLKPPTQKKIKPKKAKIIPPRKVYTDDYYFKMYGNNKD